MGTIKLIFFSTIEKSFVKFIYLQLIDAKDVIEHKESYPKLMRCMKRKTLRALDRTLNMDIIPIAEGVNLVKFELVNTTGYNIVMTGNDSR